MKCYAVVDPRKSESPPPPLPLHSAQLELGRVKRPKGLFRVSSARSYAAAAAAAAAAGTCSELRVRRGREEGCGWQVVKALRNLYSAKTFMCECVLTIKCV